MDLTNTCRMCSAQKCRVRSILEDYDDRNLAGILTDILQLEISPNDGLPQNVCKPCATILFKMRDNIEAFRENDKALRRSILDGEQPEPASVKVEIELVEMKPDLPEEEVSEVKDILPVEDPEEPADVKEEPMESSSSDEDFDKESSSDSDYSEPKRKTPKKRTPKKTQEPKDPKDTKPKLSRRRRKLDPNQPRQNDHKCYICKSESMGSAKGLLDHLSEKHLDMIPVTCTECVQQTVVLKNIRALNNHRKMHAQPYKCEYCDRRYCDDKALLYHLKTFHLGENAPCPSTCDICSKVCPSITSLRNHKRTHSLVLNCKHCDKVFHKRSKLQRHTAQVHEKAEKYPCNLCDSVLHSIQSYDAHLKIHNNIKDYQCELCPAKFHTAANLWLHRKVHENGNYKPHKDWSGHFTVTQDPERGKVYTCNHCSKTCSASGRLYAHLKHHFKDVECDQCGLKFINESSLKTHYVVHTGDRPYKCEICGKGFGQQYNMKRHMKGHQK